MMPVAYLGVMDSGCPAGFPPTVNTSASFDTFVGMMGVVRLGDPWLPHCMPDRGCHGRVVAEGSPTCFVNMLPVAYLGAMLTDGAVIVEGNPTCFVGA